MGQANRDSLGLLEPNGPLQVQLLALGRCNSIGVRSMCNLTGIIPNGHCPDTILPPGQQCHSRCQFSGLSPKKICPCEWYCPPLHLYHWQGQGRKRPDWVEAPSFQQENCHANWLTLQRTEARPSLVREHRGFS